MGFTPYEEWLNSNQSDELAEAYTLEKTKVDQIFDELMKEIEI